MWCYPLHQFNKIDQPSVICLCVIRNITSSMQLLISRWREIMKHWFKKKSICWIISGFGSGYGVLCICLIYWTTSGLDQAMEYCAFDWYSVCLVGLSWRDNRWWPRSTSPLTHGWRPWEWRSMRKSLQDLMGWR